ncbi:MAG: ABC transporter ATP-binding protein [Anaerolineales bacterium]|jgi:simple sugar transport system ATP-binding protein|nr:ABC transporter ATP-binding protein [Anaerolineales bacterium]
MPETALALDVRNITKQFPGVLANDRVNFNLRQGEIHALLGENGAGKSTLMNIIYGLYSPDQGEIAVQKNGSLQVVQMHDPHDAIRMGIGMVHQHFMLVPVFTVAENIILGEEITVGPSLDMNTARQRILKLAQDFNMPVDPDAIVEDLPVGLQQRVEILKALYRQARILVLDEPTAVLTPQEVEDLFVVMRQLTERGVSIIFITHKLKEVLAIADRITVMRRGQVVGSTTPAETDEHGLAAMMVGREVLLVVDKEPAQPKEPVLEVENLTVLDERKLEAVRGVSFQVRSGEILGVAGVQGNGQTELAETLTGLRGAKAGVVKLNGKEIPFLNPRRSVETGLSHIPEDRQKHGLVMGYSIADNEVLCTYYKPPFARGIQRNFPAIFENAKTLIKRFDVRTPGELVPAGNLSGGNQQKVIVARELSRPVNLLIANQPTRGLDVGSIEYIHKQIVNARDQGTAVLLISAELDEILSLSDRVAVMYHGQIVAILDADKTNRAELGLLMAGSKATHS